MGRPRGSGNFLERVFLKESNSLYRQVMLSFGIAAVSTLACAMFVSLVMLRAAGNLVQDRAGEVMNAQVIDNVARTTASIAQTVGRTLQYYEGVVEIVAEIALDRIVGYPEPGWETDQFVPFFDTDSKTNRYPLNSPPLPLEWQITPDVTAENIGELAPGRERFLEVYEGNFCFWTGTYFMQGQCDPLSESPTEVTYAPSCTEAHNDIDAGGVIAPTPMTNRFLYAKSSDIAALMRPLYERSPGCSSLGIYFHNGGAGSMVQYPGNIVNGIAEPLPSAGCEWMRETNSRTGRPLGTEEEIARCHPSDPDFLVPPREYNPNEQEWFHEMVRNGGNITWFGPYQWYGGNTVALSVGRSLFDRRTGNFIGVASIDISLLEIGERLSKAKLYPHSEVGILGAADGVLIADSRATSGSNSSIPTWFETGLLSESTFAEIQSSFDVLFAPGWDPETVKAALNTMSFPTPYGVAVVHPLPLVPPTNAEGYKPHYYVVQIVKRDAFSTIREVEEEIDKDIRLGFCFIVGIGVFGALLLLGILRCVSSRLTRPLQWMETVSRTVVNHSKNDVGVLLEEYDMAAATSCTPYTEITELVSEFRSMVMGFSGRGASGIAEPEARELLNTLKWQSDFRELYTKASAKKVSIRRSTSLHTRSTTPSTTPSTTTDDVSYPSVHFDSAVSESTHARSKTDISSHDASKSISQLLEIDEITNNSSSSVKMKETRTGNDEAEVEITFDHDDQLHNTTATRDKVQVEETTTASDAIDMWSITTKDDEATKIVAPSNEGAMQNAVMPENEDDMHKGTNWESNMHRTSFYTRESNGFAGRTRDHNHEVGVHVEGQSQHAPLDVTETVQQETAGALNVDPLHKEISKIGYQNKGNTDEPITWPAATNVYKAHPPGILQNEGSGISLNMVHSGRQVFPAPPKQHFGRNASSHDMQHFIPVESRSDVYRTRLFRWIVVLILLPLIFSCFAICFIVTEDIVQTVPSWVAILGVESLVVEKRALFSIAQSKAGELESILTEPIRDLYLMYRTAGWLHFNAMERSEAFTEVISPTEECKFFPTPDCPVLESETYPCPCIWEETPLIGTCVDYNSSHARNQQRRWFTLSKLDHDPLTGARNNSNSFPEHAHSAETTSWWRFPDNLPGSWRKENASGFATSYDRIRVSSALATVEFPIHNYPMSLGIPDPQVGTYAAYEADGLFVGFSGCQYYGHLYAHFVSSKENGAFIISETLCPKEKYGYDPRCRAWYNEAKEQYAKSKDTLYITAPYEFAVDGGFGVAAVSPIANPAEEEYVGELLLDFIPYGLNQALATVSEPISFVATPEPDVLGGDTVVGVNKQEGWRRSEIVSQVLPNDPQGSSLRDAFESSVLLPLRAGKEGTEEVQRSSESGTEELVIAFSPVTGTMLSSVDPSDLHKGVVAKEMHVYSVALASPMSQMREPFEIVEDDILDDVRIHAFILCTSVLFFVLVFVYVAVKLAVLVTEPVIVLLSVVQRINSKDTNKALPILAGGFRELHQVYSCFSKLHKVIHISNTAFFSGDLYSSFDILNDALHLFRNIQDRKAIGVACNNIGNMLFGMIMERGKETESSLNYGWGVKGFDCFEEAVQISQSVFEETESNEMKARFALELADRLFNRGMYMLFMYGESDAPPDAKARGIEDISRARDLDYDVRDYWLENKMLLEHSAETFLRLLRRIHGLCDHFGIHELQAAWDVREVVEEADQLLFAAWDQPSAPLFLGMSRIGRLQQLEAAAIRVETLSGNVLEAARMAMRMFAEDEYIIESSFSAAGDALLHFGNTRVGNSWSCKTIQSLKGNMRKMVRECRSPSSLDLGKCIIFAIELNEKWEGSKILDLLRLKCLDLFDKHCTNEDYISIVAYTVEGNFTLSLSSKAENLNEQRRNLERGMISTSEQVCPALPYAMQCILDTSITTEMDTFLLFITDGFSWDSDSYGSIKKDMTQMNRDREGKIHIITVGLDVEDEGVVDKCMEMSSVSKLSCFTAVDNENIDCTFSSIASLLSSHKVHQGLRRSVTMETFS